MASKSKKKNDSSLVSANQAETKKAETPDTNAPTITGVEDKTFNIGDTVTYLSGITAVDDRDGELDVEVDKSAVDSANPGEYKVIYSATDKSGNKATKQAIFTFKKATANNDELQALSLKVLNKIIDPSASKGSNLKKIYDFVHNGVGYVGTPHDAENWQNEAFYALTQLNATGYVGGDCFTYTSVDKALLEAYEVENIWCENENSPTGDHAWLLVNIGTGYYHFDATRMHSGFVCFMKTDADLDAYYNQGGYNYMRDKSKYPATPTSAFTY